LFTQKQSPLLKSIKTQRLPVKGETVTQAVFYSQHPHPVLEPRQLQIHHPQRGVADLVFGEYAVERFFRFADEKSQSRGAPSASYWTCIGRCVDSSRGNRYVYWTVYAQQSP
jgi:hypothetical protein